jgi:uncharacterized membrane protein
VVARSPSSLLLSGLVLITPLISRVLPESIKKKIVTIDDVSKLDEFIDPKMVRFILLFSL